jgi:DNA polymerase/3'-5' exonuclease PolX
VSANAARPYEEAKTIADRLVEYLRLDCKRIEIVGSLRRKRPVVHDIELLAIPDFNYRDIRAGLFTERRYVDLLEEHLLEHRLEAARGGLPPLRLHPTKPADGLRYKRLWYADIQVDLFICRPPAQWGVLKAIRTGSADFSRLLVTRLRDQRMRSDEGRVLTFGGQTVPCDEEEDFFRLCGVPHVAPEGRG